MCLSIWNVIVFWILYLLKKMENTRISELHHSLVDDEVKSNITDANGKTSL